MGLKLTLFKGRQVGIKADFFVLDTELFSDVVPVKIDRAFRQIHLRPFCRIFGPDGFFNGGILSWEKAPACLPLFIKPNILDIGKVDDHPVPTGFIKGPRQRL
jgi:hypothetical protein